MKQFPSAISKVLLVRLFKNQVQILFESAGDDKNLEWVLPNINIHANSTSLASIDLHLLKSIGISSEDISYKEQLYTFEFLKSGSNVIYITYLYLIRDYLWRKSVRQTRFFSVKNLPKNLTEIDNQIINYGVSRLQAKASYSSILSFLLQETFTMPELQLAHEALVSQSVDRRNFRKKILDLNIIDMVSNSSSKNTVPIYYRFKKSELTIYGSPFRLPKK